MPETKLYSLSDAIARFVADGSEVALGVTQESLIPFSGEKLVAVKAIQPEVAIIHVQRADRFGNAHMWGNRGIAREAAMASRAIDLTAVELKKLRQFDPEGYWTGAGFPGRVDCAGKEQRQ